MALPFADWFTLAQGWVFEHAVQPVLFALGQAALLEDAYDAIGAVFLGLAQIAFMVLVLGALQRLWPVERVRDRHAIRVDVLYTLLHRLGIFKLCMFFTFNAWLLDGLALLRARGVPTLQLDQIWPAVTDRPWVSFVLYLVALDFIGYWIHRGQHQWRWWWELHAVHHSQRQMTMWSDARGHLLDSVITDSLMALVAIAIGVPPAQFVLLVVAQQLLQDLQHANVRWSFGRLGGRLLNSPRFHRRHHAVGIGHEAGAGSTAKGVNFGVLFPWWDQLFGSADFTPVYAPTGIRDQVEQGRDYGRGFWAQQGLAFKRLASASGQGPWTRHRRRSLLR